MTVVVVGCYEWIGYHLISGYLEDGDEIIGIDDVDTSKKETLSMFFGRNAAFTHYQTIEEWLDQEKDLPSSIYMISEKYQEEFSLEQERLDDVRTVFITSEDQKKRNNKGNSYFIKVPYLYGPWMPLEEDWEHKFPDDAVFISDFIDWIKETDFSNLSNNIVLVPNGLEEERQGQANVVALLKKVKNEDGISILKEHIKKFPQYY